MWVAIHSMAAAYEPGEVPEQEVMNFVNSLAHLLPCSKCREHWVTLLKDFPVKEWLSSRESFFTWTLKVRDMVTANATKGAGKPLDHNLLRTKYGLPVQKSQNVFVGGRQARMMARQQRQQQQIQEKTRQIVLPPPAVTSAGRSTRGLVNSRTGPVSAFSRSVQPPVIPKPTKLTAARSATYTPAAAKFQTQKEKKGCKSCGRRR